MQGNLTMIRDIGFPGIREKRYLFRIPYSDFYIYIYEYIYIYIYMNIYIYIHIILFKRQ